MSSDPLYTYLQTGKADGGALFVITTSLSIICLGLAFVGGDLPSKHPKANPHVVAAENIFPVGAHNTLQLQWFKPKFPNLIPTIDPNAPAISTDKQTSGRSSSDAPLPGNDPLPTGNWTLVWGDDFNGTQLDRTKWDTNSTAYSPYNGYGGPGCRSNPKDHKLNYITDGENLGFNNGVLTITARRENRGGQPWTSGLITSGKTKGGECGTSEPSNGYLAKKGEFIIQRAKLPPEVGAWAAFWTWGDGASNGEVDVYEYHSNNPRLLEISNRITGGGCYHKTDTDLSQDWHYFGAYLGANAVDFYVDGVKVCSGKGFASNGAALIAVLDISKGTYHPVPPGNVNSMQMQIDSIHVYRQQ